MRLAKENDDHEAIRRLGARPCVGDAIINEEGDIAVIAEGLVSWTRFQSIGWRYLESGSSFQFVANAEAGGRTGWARMVGPKNVRIEPMGILTGTLGNANLEFAAACVVLYHHDNGLDEWTPILAADFFAWVRDCKTLHGWMQNPVWRPNFVGLIDDGWVDGWTTDEDKEKRMAATGIVTSKFVEAVSTPRVGGFPKIKRILS